MLNKTPWWKYLVVMLVLVIGMFYALPNIFGNDPGMIIRGARGLSVDSAAFEKVAGILQAGDITPKKITQDSRGIQIRFVNSEDQLKARDLMNQDLGDGYSSALTLISAAPAVLTDAGANPMYLGLDLRGGVHFLLQVDMKTAVDRARQRYEDDIKLTLRQGKIRYRSVRKNVGGVIEVSMRSADQTTAASNLIETELGDEIDVVNDDAQPELLRVSINQSQLQQIKTFALEQNMTALRNRIDQLGVAEPVVQQQGAERIVVQLPGVQDTERAKRILGRAATLEMRMVDEKNTAEAEQNSQAPPGSRLYKFRDGGRILLFKRIIYSGDNIIDAAASIDTQTGAPVVNITLDAEGARKNSRITAENINNRMAVVYVELVATTSKDADGKVILDQNSQPKRVTTKIEEVITAPVIRAQLGKRFLIEGIGGVDEARDLALLLRSGALAAPVEIIEERTVGPSLGQANISQGFNSVIVGFLLVLAFMLLYYRVFGIVANVALAVNLVLMVAVLSLFQATLTLPGVAGIVLTVGMAVDANVLIFERIREEIRTGNSPQASIHMGYDKALSTIVDANVTTLIAAIVLFNFGTGPIKGFAVTLSIGILTSMFTAILLTRVLINWFYGGKNVKRLLI